MADIFLSYNREDAAIAKAYAEAFAREGFDVWWDATLRSGETYDEVTEAALRAAKAVVVLWSPRSVASRWVRAEATIAHRNKTLMPVMIEVCDRPVMFELTQTAELAHWRGAADDKVWQAFLGDVRRKVGSSANRPVEAASDPVPAPAPATAGGGVPFVAVLPFTCRAGDDEMEVLAEDLTEEITRELARNHFFKVMAARTMAAWRGKSVDYQALGRQLEARYLIDCKLQRAGEDIRLTVQLIDVDTANMVWSPRFVRRANEIAASSEEFPVAVASQLGEQIVQLEMDRASKKQGLLSGWEHVLRSMSYGRRLSLDGFRLAIEEARKAVSLAPDLGMAHANLAAFLASSGSFTDARDDARRREIQAHLTRAMQLDGDNSAVLIALVNAYGALGDFDAGLRIARRAVELDPNSAQSQYALGRAYLAIGRTAEAIAPFKRQLQLGPRDFARVIALQQLGMCLFLEGKLAEAEDAIDQALTLHPDFALGLVWKAIIAAQQGQEQIARATVIRLREVETGLSFDQHVRHVTANPLLRERTADAVATFRHLWDETGGDA